ncbi:MAG: hypothetical protein N2111_08705 [Candidatus Sumerlaeaceae bacterium]|nr:hypothetical protein [Candidatus Sumerlaeaceae bacterium]
MTRFLKAVGVVLVSFAASGAVAVLPEEGLKRAQKAEQLLRAEQVDEAVKVLEALTKDYPKEAAVFLRLAQVFDISGKAGPALHCYRRYVELAGPKALEEARLRVQTLELVASAREDAAAYAKSRREATRAVATPVPVVNESVEILRPDGSTAPLTPESLPQVLAEHVSSVSTRSADGLAAPVFPGDVPPVGDRRPVTQEAEPVAALENRDPRPTETAPATGTPKRAVASPVSQPAAPLPPPPTPQEQPTRSDKSPIRIAVENPAWPSNPRTDLPPRPAVSNDAMRARTPKRQTVSATAHQPTDARTARFVERLFRESQTDGQAAKLEVVNRFQMTVITFGAIPLGRGEPVNIILSTGERRSVTLSPGLYEVMLTVTTTTYPPTTLADRRFEFEFREGTRYSATLTTELFE